MRISDISDKAGCRTAPAIPGLFVSIYLNICSKTIMKKSYRTKYKLGLFHLAFIIAKFLSMK